MKNLWNKIKQFFNPALIGQDKPAGNGLYDAGAEESAQSSDVLNYPQEAVAPKIVVINRPPFFKLTLEMGDKKDKSTLKYEAFFINAVTADEALELYFANVETLKISPDYNIVRIEEVPFDAYMIIQAD